MVHGYGGGVFTVGGEGSEWATRQKEERREGEEGAFDVPTEQRGQKEVQDRSR